MKAGFSFKYRSSKRRFSLRHTPIETQVINAGRESWVRRGLVHLLWAVVFAILAAWIVESVKGQVVEQFRAYRHTTAPSVAAPELPHIP
jgi:hypothetical protein